MPENVFPLPVNGKNQSVHSKVNTHTHMIVHCTFRVQSASICLFLDYTDTLWLCLVLQGVPRMLNMNHFKRRTQESRDQRLRLIKYISLIKVTISHFTNYFFCTKLKPFNIFNGYSAAASKPAFLKENPQ